ncbi:4'-phosphopantetheinyl transferase family protein [Marinomonas balearica]|uniref:Enterobactin synthase component D n=1 Tax=Marinomonas balearica TaxID=491947 RepID=A0A4R6MBD5_9GAMM|nr:4'-phosphopantetheinyl transferase superfamily protein [Marinomonas balearica]TDO98908.1 4'-phosphopantetheinyl transferase EntD [Marinomonas balearica]
MTKVSDLYLQAGVFVPVSYFQYSPERLSDYEALFFGDFPEGYEKWVVKRKASFVAGRLAVQNLLQHVNIPNVVISRAEDGSPIWPKGWKGSIAHADNQAVACVISHDLKNSKNLTGLGIDVENLEKSNLLFETQKMIANDGEVILLESRGYARDIALTMIFSIKESVFKAVYPAYGKYFDFLDAELISASDSNEWQVRLTTHLSDIFPKGFTLRVKAWIENECVYSYSYW